MRRKLPEIERRSDERIRREYAKPSSVFKLYWKWILGAVLLTIFGCFLIFLLIPKPDCILDDNCSVNKTCQNSKCVDPCENKCGSHQSAFCTVNSHKAICNCENNLKWVSDSCHQCVNRLDCDQNRTCFFYQCTHLSSLFECGHKMNFILKTQRCDGENNCHDGSDEKCGKKTSTFF